MPPNKRGRLATVGHAQFNNLVPDNGAKIAPAQDRESVQIVWTREARRLAGEFSLTGDWKHFTALVRHVAGMSWPVNRSPLQRIRRLLERSTTA
jgi:hypothetical protein